MGQSWTIGGGTMIAEEGAEGRMIARNGAVIRRSMNMARSSIGRLIICTVVGLSLWITPIAAHPVATDTGGPTSIAPEQRGDQKWLLAPPGGYSLGPSWQYAEVIQTVPADNVEGGIEGPVIVVFADGQVRSAGVAAWGINEVARVDAAHYIVASGGCENGGCILYVFGIAMMSHTLLPLFHLRNTLAQRRATDCGFGFAFDGQQFTLRATPLSADPTVRYGYAANVKVYSGPPAPSCHT